jgi:hypothetical protein
MRCHDGLQPRATFIRESTRGVLFPYLSGVRAGDRATEFKQRHSLRRWLIACHQTQPAYSDEICGLV